MTEMLALPLINPYEIPLPPSSGFVARPKEYPAFVFKEHTNEPCYWCGETDFTTVRPPYRHAGVSFPALQLPTDKAKAFHFDCWDRWIAGSKTRTPIRTNLPQKNVTSKAKKVKKVSR